MVEAGVLRVAKLRSHERKKSVWTNCITCARQNSGDSGSDSQHVTFPDVTQQAWV